MNAADQRLCFADRVLQDGRPITAFHVEEDTTIKLTKEGGAPVRPERTGTIGPEPPGG